MRGILVSGLFAFLFSFFVTPLFIKFLARRGYGQQIRDDGPQSHHVKRGTPTMGGVVLVLAAIIGYLSSHLITRSDFTASAFLVIGLIIGLAFVGFIDDWLKVVKQRSLGLRAREKLLGQALVAAIFAIFGLRYPDERGLSPISAHLSTVRDTSLVLGAIAVAIWAIFLVLGSSNGVNLKIGRAHV